MSSAYLIIFSLIVIGLSLPSALAKRSLIRFLLNVLISFFGVLVPIGVFLLSTFLVPDAKDLCEHGWLDCFFGGKFALSPLVFWAVFSLYVVEILRIKRPVGATIVLGLWTGASVAAVCFLYCLFEWKITGPICWWLIVPLYTALWYGWRAFQLGAETQITAKQKTRTVFGSVPFWIGSVVWSQKWYESLPEHQTGCFVVTAAGRGHHHLVGPFIEISRHGRKHCANQQLLTLWQFEAMWQKHAPHSHAILRRLYNRIGPVIASRINSLWLADATYLALKPAEWIARIVLKISANNKDL